MNVRRILGHIRREGQCVSRQLSKFLRKVIMDDIIEKKKEQIKALIEKSKQSGELIDWATIVLC